MNYPHELDQISDRLNRRLHRKAMRKVATTVVSFALILTLFLGVVVNYFPSFAYTLHRVPLVKELMKALQFNEDLRLYVDNDYIHKVDAADGDVRIPYLIYDERQLILFVQFPQKVYHDARASITDAQGKELQAAYSWRSMPELEYEVYTITADAIPQDVSFKLEVFVQETGTELTSEAIFEERPSEKIEHTYNFKLKLPQPLPPTQYPVDQTLDIDGQKITIEYVSVYPTGTEVVVQNDPQNSKQVDNLRFLVNGEASRIANGVSASTTETGRKKFFLPSTYFEETRLTTLKIRSLTLLDEKHATFRVDLANQKILDEVPGVKLTSVRQDGRYHEVTFALSSMAPYDDYIRISTGDAHSFSSYDTRPDQMEYVIAFRTNEPIYTFTLVFDEVKTFDPPLEIELKRR